MYFILFSLNTWSTPSGLLCIYRHALICSHCPLPGLGDSTMEFKLCRASVGSICSAPLQSGPLLRCSAPRLTSAPFWAASIGFERWQLWRRLISRGFYFHRFGWASSSRAKSPTKSRRRVQPTVLCVSLSLFFYGVVYCCYCCCFVICWCCLLLQLPPNATEAPAQRIAWAAAGSAVVVVVVFLTIAKQLNCNCKYVAALVVG